MAFFFTAVASYIVGLVGNSNSPVSGMTITAVLFTGGLLYIFGFFWYRGNDSYARCSCNSMLCCMYFRRCCNDLKTGQIVGATPYRQQTMQIAGVAVASLVMAPIMQLLHENTPGGLAVENLQHLKQAYLQVLQKAFLGTAFFLGTWF